MPMQAAATAPPQNSAPAALTKNRDGVEIRMLDPKAAELLLVWPKAARILAPSNLIRLNDLDAVKFRI